VDVAVKVTLVPPQIVFPGLALMLTEGTSTAFTLMVIALLVVIVGDAQVALEVSPHVTTSLLDKVAFV
jgi:hypothetical protein